MISKMLWGVFFSGLNILFNICKEACPLKLVLCVLSVWLKFQYLWRRWLEWRRAEWRSCHRSQSRTQTKTSQVSIWGDSQVSQKPRPQSKHSLKHYTSSASEFMTAVVIHTNQICACCPPDCNGDIVVLQPGFVYHLTTVFYVKRSSSGSSYGFLWRLGRTQFTCPSRALRDQWIKHLRAALKTHSKDGYRELDYWQRACWLSTTSDISNVCFRSIASEQAVGVYQPVWREEERQTDI